MKIKVCNRVHFIKQPVFCNKNPPRFSNFDVEIQGCFSLCLVTLILIINSRDFLSIMPNIYG